jgi:hypothetical protein
MALISQRAIVTFSAGFAAFLPVGAMYLAVMCLGIYVLVNIRDRLSTFSFEKKTFAAIYLYILVILLSLLYTLYIGAWTDASASRLFHSARVILLISIGLLLTKEERNILLRGFLIGSIFCAAVFFINAGVELPDFVIWHSMLSVTGNASSQKMLMLACAGAIFFSYFLKTGSKIAFFIFACYFGVVFILGQSRNAQLIAIVLLLLIPLLFRRNWFIPSILLGLAIICLTFIVSDLFSDKLIAATKEAVAHYQLSDCSGSVSVRLKMWSAAVDQTLRHVFTGTGLGTWESIWPTYTSACPQMSTINNPHNDFALAGMELGIFGFITTFYLYVVLFQRALFSSKTTGDHIGIIFISCLIISSIFNAPLRDAALGMALVLFSTGLVNCKNRLGNY